MKTTTLLHKKLLLFLTLLVLWSCEKDKLSEPVPQETNTDKTELSIAKINLEELPSFIMDNNSRNIQRKSNSYFGVPKKGVSVYISTNHKGYKSYTIALSKTPSAKNTSLYFDNWVINKYKNGTKKEYIIRYEPTEKWYYSSNDFKIYSGRITFYTTTGKRINSILMREGQVLDKAKSNFAAKAARGTCHLRLKQVVTICTDGGHLGGSGNTSGVGCTTTYYYDLDCHGGGGGGGDNGGHDGGSGGGGGNGSGSSGGSEHSEIPTVGNEGGWTPPIIAPFEIINELKGKADCVYKKLNQGSANFVEAIKKFDGEFPIAHLKYSMDYSLANTTNAVTNNTSTNYIEIKINGNTLATRTVLGLARTLAHETIHAELYRKVRSVGGQVSINDFPGIYDYYRRYVKGWQHQQMAAHYRQTIVDILKQFDNSNHTDRFYNDLAWEGLHNTVAWRELSSTERMRISNVIINYKSNGNKTCN